MMNVLNVCDDLSTEMTTAEKMRVADDALDDDNTSFNTSESINASSSTCRHELTDSGRVNTSRTWMQPSSASSNIFVGAASPLALFSTSAADVGEPPSAPLLGDCPSNSISFAHPSSSTWLQRDVSDAVRGGSRWLLPDRPPTYIDGDSVNKATTSYSSVIGPEAVSRYLYHYCCGLATSSYFRSAVDMMTADVAAAMAAVDSNGVANFHDQQMSLPAAEGTSGDVTAWHNRSDRDVGAAPRHYVGECNCDDIKDDGDGGPKKLPSISDMTLHAPQIDTRKRKRKQFWPQQQQQQQQYENRDDQSGFSGSDADDRMSEDLLPMQQPRYGNNCDTRRQTIITCSARCPPSEIDARSRCASVNDQLEAVDDTSSQPTSITRLPIEEEDDPRRATAVDGTADFRQTERSPYVSASHRDNFETSRSTRHVTEKNGLRRASTSVQLLTTTPVEEEEVNVDDDNDIDTDGATTGVFLDDDELRQLAVVIKDEIVGRVDRIVDRAIEMCSTLNFRRRYVSDDRQGPTAAGGDHVTANTDADVIVNCQTMAAGAKMTPANAQHCKMPRCLSALRQPHQWQWPFASNAAAGAGLGVDLRRISFPALGAVSRSAHLLPDASAFNWTDHTDVQPLAVNREDVHWPNDCCSTKKKTKKRIKVNALVMCMLRNVTHFRLRVRL